MIYVYGTRFYGRVRACGRSYVATKFLHIWFIPLIPLGSRLVLEEVGNAYRSLPTPFSFKSMLAGYLRIWGPLATVGALVSMLGALDDASGAEALVVGALVGMLVLGLVAATVLAWSVLGKLSEEEKQKRAVYALHTGYFVDPEEMGDARHGLRHAMLATIGERARGLAGMGYRGPGDPAQTWPHYALDPTHRDDALVTAAFTLARIDASLSSGPQKLHFEQLHERIWQRIRASNPPYLNAHAAC